MLANFQLVSSALGFVKAFWTGLLDDDLETSLSPLVCRCRCTSSHLAQSSKILAAVKVKKTPELGELALTVLRAFVGGTVSELEVSY